jgi:hypothetical protein
MRLLVMKLVVTKTSDEEEEMREKRENSVNLFDRNVETRYLLGIMDTVMRLTRLNPISSSGAAAP